MEEKLTDRRWQAIAQCDASFDGEFYYGVSTTGIFCRPSCKSKTPAREHVRIFRNADEALARRFRPCKRCKPDGLSFPDAEWCRRMKDWLDAHYGENVTLERLAETFHASPFHLQRIFKRIEGVSPAVYLQRIRMDEAGRLLEDTDLTVGEIGAAVGVSSAAHFSTLFHRFHGASPTQYRMHARKAGSRDVN